jgi:tetratricopeptide (TPR) repeat protein
MLLSCLSKGVAVVFPLVCLLLDYWHGRRWSLSLFLEKAPMFALSLLFGLIALDVQKGGDFHGLLTLSGEKVKALSSVFGLGQKMLFAGYGYMMYFFKTFLPLRLCTFYPYPTEVELRGAAYMGGAVFMLGTAALAVWSAKKAKVVTFGFGWIFATVILVLQFISVGVVIMADRYFYLPSAGLFFMLTYAAEVYWLQKNPSLRKVWWGVLGTFALWCLVLSRAQTSTWADSESLWKQVLRFYPKEDQALEPLANWYGKQGRVAEAEQMLELAVSDGSDRPIVFSALANCIAIKASNTTDTAAQRALRERAFSLYAQSLALNPKNADTYFNRAFTALSINPELSLADLDSAAAIAPYKALIFKQMKGTAFNNLKRHAEAEQILTEVIAGYEASATTLKIAEEKQRYADAYLERGLARFNAGKRPEGLADVEKSLSIVPENPRATGVLGQMRQLMGR